MDKIAIMDMDSIAYSIGHPNKVLDEEGNPLRTEDNSKYIYKEKTEEELEASTIEVMDRILTAGGFNGYIGYIKGRNTIKERLNVNNEYKGNRKLEQPKWWSYVKNLLITKWGIHEVNDMEVDDAVNITRLNIPNSYICAIDKDLLSLEGFHFNWNKKTKYGYSIEWVEITKAYADYIFWKDMIIGQSGDNIKGIPGIGKNNKIFTEKTFIPNKNYVLDLYCDKFGEEDGINEFYKNYKCLKIKEKQDGFLIPEIIKYNLNVNTENSEKEWL